MKKNYFQENARKFLEVSAKENLPYMTTKVNTDYQLLLKAKIKNKTILNIGCFEPLDELYFARQAKSWIVTALNKEEVHYAKKVLKEELSTKLFKKFKFRDCDATKLPFKNNSFDLVLCFSTLDHIPSKEKRQKAIFEMKRVCKKKGHVVITVPNKLQLLYALGKKPFYEHCFTPFELKTMIQTTGLKITDFASTLNAESTSYGSTLPGRVIYRLIKPFYKIFGLFGVRMGYLCKNT